MNWRRMISLKMFMLAAFMLAAPVSAASAATFTVNSTGDAGDGTCDATECTLREAIVAANATNTPDSITFAIPPTGANCPNGVYTITLRGIAEIRVKIGLSDHQTWLKAGYFSKDFAISIDFDCGQ